MRLELSLKAIAEARAASRFYEKRVSGLGDRFAEAIQKSVDMIEDAPRTWSRLPGSELRRFVVKGFPYVIHYLVEDNSILIVSIAHTSREPGYWHDRLS